MTNEEAIAILKRNKPTTDTRKCGIELCEAIDIAIDALERQKDIPKAIDDIEEVVYAECYDMEYQIIMRYIRKRLGEDDD